VITLETLAKKLKKEKNLKKPNHFPTAHKIREGPCRCSVT
jgi:hypothetical protein